MYSGNDLKKDILIELDSVPYRVIESSHHAMGRGGGLVRAKIKNLVTGNVLERSFRPTDKIPAAGIERSKCQFLYTEGTQMIFMNEETYEQEAVDAGVLGDQARFIAEGSSVNLLSFKKNVIGLEIPNAVYLKVTETEPGVRGDTATTAMKQATIETGVIVNVPLFINIGDVIKVDTRSGQYLERQK